MAAKKTKDNTKKVIKFFGVIIIIKGCLLVKKWKINNKEKVKTLILKPKIFNNSKNKYSKWDKARKQEKDL